VTDMRILNRFVPLALLASGAVLSGCFSMQPVQNVTPEPGTSVAIDINDAGRTALEPTMGRDIAQVHGNLVRQDSDAYYVAVTNVDFIRGGSQTWTGEIVPIKTSYASAYYTQVFSLRRTAAAGAVVAVALAVMTRQGLSAGTPPTGGDQTPPPDTKQRVPQGLRIPLQPAHTLRVIHHLWSALALRF